MLRKFVAASALASCSLILACADNPATPLSPTAGPQTSAAAVTDATLKATAPTIQSPANGTRVTDFRVTLSVGPASGTFVPLSGNVAYQFQVFDANGTLLEDSGVQSSTSYAFPRELGVDRTYSWRARAVLNDQGGPWANATFLSPQFPEAYVRGSELYEPLWTGKTVAIDMNDVTFVPNEGIRLNSRNSIVVWRIDTLTDGEFSLEAKGIRNSGEDWKTKIMSMLDLAGANITDNAYRVTVDKRSEWENQGSRVRFTMRSRGRDAGEPRGGFQVWNRDTWYFWHFVWGGGTAVLTVREGGPTGPIKEQLSTQYAAPYAPPVHGIRLGSTGGRNLPESLPNVVIRNVFVGREGTRPSFPPVPGQ